MRDIDIEEALLAQEHLRSQGRGTSVGRKMIDMVKRMVNASDGQWIAAVDEDQQDGETVVNGFPVSFPFAQVAPDEATQRQLELERQVQQLQRSLEASRRLASMRLNELASQQEVESEAPKLKQLPAPQVNPIFDTSIRPVRVTE